MKILIAPDSFKGTLTATEAADAIAEGFLSALPGAEMVQLPVADGGEGTLDSLVAATGGKRQTVTVSDPVGRQISAAYGILDHQICVIEAAQASGLLLLKEEERSALHADSRGTGELIRAALNAGYRSFIIGLGGTAVNDGGAGMLQALGMRLLNSDGEPIPAGGAGLAELDRIDLSEWDKRIDGCSFLLANDVQNPLTGPDGATFVFGAQKGADAEGLQMLERNLQRFADKIKERTGIDLDNMKGAGAAGGMAGAFVAFMNGRLQPGIDVVLDAVQFDRHAADADLIITGEGRSDSQTLSGKAPHGIAQRVRRAGKPVILLSGSVEGASRTALLSLFDEVHAAADGAVTIEEAMQHPAYYLRKKAGWIAERFRCE